MELLMENISQDAWPEVIFGSSDSAYSQRIRRAVNAGQLKKIGPALYTSNLKDTPESIVARHLYTVLGALYPDAILSHRSGIEAGPTSSHFIVLTYKYTRNIKLPGITIRLLKGPAPQSDDTRFMGKLYLASNARALLENMQHGRGTQSKTLTTATIEQYLDKICQINGVEKLNTIRSRARELADTLNMHAEYAKLDAIIGALLGTRTEKVLRTRLGKARAAGQPFDEKRIALFTNLADVLCKLPLPTREDNHLTTEAITNLAFFEAYFSNYIEGTTFTVHEAENIIFHHKTIPNRTADTHDVLGTFRIVSNTAEMSKVPTSIKEHIDLLTARHATILAGRPDKMPGQFKTIDNRAGNKIFVQPDLVAGTLKETMPIYDSVPVGLARAILMMFICSEIHPFLDGNGRLARIMMNAELVSTNICRIIIPTIFREDYLLALKKLSKTGDPNAYIRMLDRAQAFTASIDFSDYERALAQLTKSNAFLEPYEGKLIINHT
jgi:hypothetical protein